ncbi:MAG: DUF5661 family protein [Candidatus Binatia bacterium]
MKRKNFQQVTSIVSLGFALMLFVKSDHTWAQAQQPQLRQSVELKFEEYRRAIRNAYQIDIKNYKDKMPGGHADGKAVINYDLKQLLTGIDFERDHTKDDMLALELAMDHLERIADYYTRLERMYWDCRAEEQLNR